MPKPRKILNANNAVYLHPLFELMEKQNKETLAYWAIDYSEHLMMRIWNKYYPDDLRTQNALNSAKSWLAGDIKLPKAKKAILECHTAAREAYINPAAQAAARAIGQSASTIHCSSHSRGLPLYGCLAVAYDILGVDSPSEQLLQCIIEESERMFESLRVYPIGKS